MTLPIWRKALKQFAGDEHITLSGGEPTLHPDFRIILMDAIAEFDSVFVATNGSIKANALLLAKLAQRGVIAADLSWNDGYHDEFSHMVSPEVVAAFKPVKKELYGSSADTRNQQGYRSVSRICARGAAEEEDFEGTTVDECACDDTTVWPDGGITPCGCEDSPSIGNVWKGYTMPDEWEYGNCWRKFPELFEPGRKIAAAGELYFY
jgi:MoaA/NifB/PqqE/SkfB family radical SAM enzyme